MLSTSEAFLRAVQDPLIQLLLLIRHRRLFHQRYRGYYIDRRRSQFRVHITHQVNTTANLN